jgi:hypothetical protein
MVVTPLKLVRDGTVAGDIRARPRGRLSPLAITKAG